VFVTKYRKEVITKEVITSDILKDIEKILSRLCKNAKSELIEFKGESDHVHLLVDISPDIAPSKLVNTLKTISSRMIRKKYAQYLKSFYGKPVFWTGAYFVTSTGGAPLETLKDYIKSQDSPDDSR
jgi:putative transposase